MLDTKSKFWNNKDQYQNYPKLNDIICILVKHLSSYSHNVHTLIQVHFIELGAAHDPYKRTGPRYLAP